MLGHDRFLAQIGLGGLPFADTARSIELLATEVLPIVRRETTASSLSEGVVAASGKYPSR